jgi:integrase
VSEGVANEYLVKKHNVWTVVVNVPPKLRQTMKRVRFKRSLKTESLAKANRDKHQYVSEWKRQIALAEQGLEDPLALVRQKALEFREALLAPGAERLAYGRHETDADDMLLDQINEEAKAVLAEHGKQEADAFHKVATAKATPILNHYPLWIEQSQDTGQTKLQHGTAVKRYLAWSGQSMTVEETTRKKAREYITKLLADGELTRRTIERHVSSLSSLWRWLFDSGLIEDDTNVWKGHRLGTKKKDRAKKKRKALPDELLLKLLHHTHNGEKLYKEALPDLVRLDLLCGARIDELCALKCADVKRREDGYWFNFTDGKTEAALRKVPVHELGDAIIERRLADGDEYFFKGLLPGGPDNKRSWHVSKAYGRFRAGAGVGERGQDFHALRNTFIAVLEGEGIPESTVKLIVGHERNSMTFGVYSKGERVKLRGIINQLHYGAEVMRAIATGVGTTS